MQPRPRIAARFFFVHHGAAADARRSAVKLIESVVNDFYDEAFG